MREFFGWVPHTHRPVSVGLQSYATLEKPPKIANNAKNIEIGSILITVQAIDFARVQASLPSAFVAAAGQSIAASTSE